MRRIFSVLLAMLTAVCILAPRAFAAAPAPNPAPAAFTGGDATYEAMCALAGMVVAAPIVSEVNPCTEVSPYNCYTSQPGGTHLYDVYTLHKCYIDLETGATTHYSECFVIKANDALAHSIIQWWIERYEQMMGQCSPPLPTCMLPPGAQQVYKIKLCEGDECEGGEFWFNPNPTRVRLTSPIPWQDLAIETNHIVEDEDLPICRPGIEDFCENAEIICVPAAYAVEDFIPCEPLPF